MATKEKKHKSKRYLELAAKVPKDKLFDPAGPNPVVLAMGDAVRFRPISQEEFDTWS